jgi:hypothetical protein
MNLAKCLCVVSIVLGLLAPSDPARAQDALVGSWVLDPAASKSSVAELLPTGGTLQIAAAGDGKFASMSEVTVGGMTGRTEITFAVDGKDYAVTATPAQPGVTLTQSIEGVSDTVYNSSLKVNGQLFATAVTEISGDRNTLTQTSTGMGQFAGLSSTMVFKRK